MSHAQRLIIIGLLIFANSTACALDDPASLIEEGNKAYNEGQFEQALEKYQIVKQQDNASPYLEYNIGNALFRLGRMGEALAAFRRAQRELPRDADLLHNLSLAEEKLNLPASPTDTLTAQRVIGFPSKVLSRYEFQIIALCCYVILWAVITWNWTRQRKRSWGLPGFCFVIGALAGLLGWDGVQTPGGLTLPAFMVQGNRLAVVKASETKAYSGDSETFQVVSVLSQGIEIMTGELRPEWVEVYFTDGRRGWIKRTELDFVGAIES